MNRYIHLFFLVAFILFSPYSLFSNSNDDLLQLYLDKYKNNIDKQINWENEPYTLRWTNFNNNIIILEYLPGNDKPEQFINMITIQISNEDIMKSVSSFLDITKNYRVNDPAIFKNQNGDIIIDAMLFDFTNDIMEHNLIKIYKASNGYLYKIFYHTRLKFSLANENKTIIEEKIGKPKANRLDFLTRFIYPED